MAENEYNQIPTNAAGQQPYGQPVYPVYQPAPVMALTGLQKFAWLFVGFSMGLVGIVIASMCNLDKPYRSDCTKMAAIGFVIALVLGIILGVFVSIMAAAAGSYYGY